MRAFESNFYPYPVIHESDFSLPDYDRSLKYCRHASFDFNDRLDSTLHRLVEDVSEALDDNLVALILGGGYGRGEGGVVEVAGFELPYNDLDLVLVVDDKRAVRQESLSSISHRYEEELKIHVDFSRPLTIEDIRNWPRSLMWQNLLNGHVVLYGPQDVILSNAPASLRDPLPVIEATRLLLNRGAGLLWAMRVARGVEEAPDADFVPRNYFKCGLALGDAALITHGRFATPYRGRKERLAALAMERGDVAALNIELIYEISLTFKFTPGQAPWVPMNHSSLAILSRLWGEVFLHVERARTGRDFYSLQEYCKWLGLREPEQHRPEDLARNFVRNIQLGNLSWLYPREWLYRRLPVLLGLAGREVADWPAESERFLVVWKRFD